MKNFNLKDKKILITGVAGFIGANLAKQLLERFEDVKIIGIDNLNAYYDVSLKNYRLASLLKNPNFKFVKADISNKCLINYIFSEHIPDIVVNFAAQAGVRYSITNPDDYIESNIIGFYNILEACRETNNCYGDGIKHLVFASSSSIYGHNKSIPYSTKDISDSPVSLYAATKKSNELLAYAYSTLYGLPTTGLRFFTVYGPAGRPDMAYFKFADKLKNGEKIQIFNHGNLYRDFTFIDDIVEGVINVLENVPSANSNGVKYKIYNIGNSKPEKLIDFVTILQEELISAKVLSPNYDFESHKEFVGMQPGDVEITYADVNELENDFGFKPSTDLRTGLRKFAKWYKEFYK